MATFIIMMKNIIKIIIILFVTSSSRAQTNIIDLAQTASVSYNYNNGSTYIEDVNNIMNPYVGTWKYTQGNKEFILTLIKQVKYHYNQGNDNYYEDRLIGYYVYKESGVIIASTLNDNLNSDYLLKVELSMYAGNKVISIEDYLKNKKYLGYFLNINNNQIKILLKEQERLIRVKEGQPMPTNMPLPGNTFPLEMILTKQ